MRPTYGCRLAGLLGGPDLDMAIVIILAASDGCVVGFVQSRVAGQRPCIQQGGHSHVWHVTPRKQKQPLAGQRGGVRGVCG